MSVVTSSPRRIVALVISIAVLLQLLPQQAHAEIKDKVIIHVGKPTVWSRGQAHYLLARMHSRNQQLEPPLINNSLLDPNAANARRIQIIKSLLDIEGQFNQRIGTLNRAALREQRFDLRRREGAEAELAERENEHKKVSASLADLKRRQGILKAKQKARYGADGIFGTDDDPPAANDEQRKQRQADYEPIIVEIAELQAMIDDETAQKTAIEADLTKLETTATGDVAPPTLTDPELSTQASALPSLDVVKEYVERAIKDAPNPTFAASIALDNFISMQQEVIAKQLTLLRDEVGPDERIVFLELPSSIYTADDRADNYVAQVQWRVTGLKREDNNTYYEKREKTLDQLNTPSYAFGDTDYKKKWKSVAESEVNANLVRAVDIIPRQSALNVNDVQATAKRTNILGVMKWLIGLGVKVNYQKQKELYENFLQQEVFAAGFGKGLHTFGWTFGPLPGSKRMSSGVRTTYAVLAVPRNARELTVEATAIAFHREKTPQYTQGLNGGVPAKTYSEDSRQFLAKETFDVRLPSEEDDTFKVHSVYYTPARKGEFVTVVVKGDSFSPQMGVMVEDMPLKKVVSLSNNLSSNAVREAAGSTGVMGWFEQVSTNEVVMTFAMGDKNNAFTGTPNITLVTPERSSSLSFLKLWINEHRPKQMLRDLTLTDPMFVDAFSLKPELPYTDKGTYYEAMLKGTGLRRKAEVWVNGEELKLCRPRKWELLNQEMAIAAGKQASDEEALDALKNKLATEHTVRVCAERRLACGASPDGSFNALGGEIKDTFIRTQLRFDDEIIAELKKRDLLAQRCVVCVIKERELFEIDKKKGLSDEEKEAAKKKLLQEIDDAERAVFDAVEAKYEAPVGPDGRSDKCVIERTTEEYVLRFPKSFDVSTRSVKYRHRTVRGFETGEFEAKNPTGTPEAPYKIVSYRPNAARQKALLDIRFTAKDDPKPRIVNDEDGRLRKGPFWEDDGHWRAVFEVDYILQGTKLVERDNIPVTITRKKKNKEGKETDESVTFDIPLPLRPEVLKIVNPRSGKPAGYADEQPVVTLVGFNLKSIAKVFFGDTQAAIIGSPDYGSLLVKVPKGGTVAKGEAIQVPVVLEKLDGTKVSSVVYYTYLGEPVPVIVVKKPPGKRQKNVRQQTEEIADEPEDEP